MNNQQRIKGHSTMSLKPTYGTIRTIKESSKEEVFLGVMALGHCVIAREVRIFSWGKEQGEPKNMEFNAPHKSFLKKCSVGIVGCGPKQGLNCKRVKLW